MQMCVCVCECVCWHVSIRRCTYVLQYVVPFVHICVGIYDIWLDHTYIYTHALMVM